MTEEFKLKVDDLTVSSLGKAIYNSSIKGDISERDKLLDEFLERVRYDLSNGAYNFNIEIQALSSSGFNMNYTNVPKLLIHTAIVDVKDITRTFYILREYFEIQGNLRLTNHPYYLKGNDDGDLGFFKNDEHNLTLVLDFVEYKCNDIYKESMIKL
jgi:hypothetical protein